jgi:hypothetical protein
MWFIRKQNLSAGWEYTIDDPKIEIRPLVNGITLHNMSFASGGSRSGSKAAHRMHRTTRDYLCQNSGLFVELVVSLVYRKTEFESWGEYDL